MQPFTGWAEGPAGLSETLRHPFQRLKAKPAILRDCVMVKKMFVISFLFVQYVQFVLKIYANDLAANVCMFACALGFPLQV